MSRAMEAGQISFLGSTPLARLPLDDAVAYLAKHPILEGIVAFGSTGAPGQPPWADNDLFLIVNDWPPAVRVGLTLIDGRLTDLLFAQPAAIDRLQASAPPIEATSWDGRLARALSAGRVLLDRAGQLGAAQRHVQGLAPPVVVPSASEAYRYWFRINYNRLQTRRMLESEDPDYMLAVDARLLYMLSETFTGYFSVRGLIWDGEKSAIRYLRVHDSHFLEQFNACIAASHRQGRFQLYEDLARNALAPIGHLWEQIPTAFDSDTGADAGLDRARELWQTITTRE